jgi:hypothetical protein
LWFDFPKPRPSSPPAGIDNEGGEDDDEFRFAALRQPMDELGHLPLVSFDLASLQSEINGEGDARSPTITRWVTWDVE